MLVLTRKEGQRIFIGKDIKVRVVEISRRVVRLAIEAPGNVEIQREERVHTAGRARAEEGGKRC